MKALPITFSILASCLLSRICATTSHQSLLRRGKKQTNAASSSVTNDARNLGHDSGPQVRNFFLEAKEAEIAFGNGGIVQTMMTYNGMVPGPSFEANVGDTLRVHFTNNLAIETTIHWHGVEVPANMDGSPLASASGKIGPGKTFMYEFELQRAGTFWYHPHDNANANKGVELGLYGSLVVHDPIVDVRYPRKDPLRFL